MKLFTLITALACAVLVLGFEGLSARGITPTGLTRVASDPWPPTATCPARRSKRVTNAHRFSRGLPLERPTRLYHANAKRQLAAPSQGVAGPNVYLLVGCNSGGDSFFDSFPISGTLQEMVDECAAFQAAQASGGTTFGVWPDGQTCYVGIDTIPVAPVSCDSVDAIIADYSPT